VEGRSQLPLERLLAQAEVPPELTQGLLTRLEAFVRPFPAALAEPAQRRPTVADLTGLGSKLEPQTSPGIASLPDRERHGLPKFLGEVPWDPPPRLGTRARQSGADLGEPEGVIVFDPWAFAPKGTESVGVARPGGGRLGQIANCPVGFSRGSVSRKDPAIVKTRLDLPNEGATDRVRRQGAGVPRAVQFRTRPGRARERLEEPGSLWPQAGVAGGDQRGRSSGFRRELGRGGARSLLAVPWTTWARDRDEPPPEDAGRGRRPPSPLARRDRRRARGSRTAPGPRSRCATARRVRW
jgi:hypothetical protein